MPLPFLLRLGIKTCLQIYLQQASPIIMFLLGIMKNHKLRAIKMGADC